MANVEDSQVACVRSDRIDEIYKSVVTTLDDVLRGNGFVEEQQRIGLTQRFEETFRTAMAANIVFTDDKSVHEASRWTAAQRSCAESTEQWNHLQVKVTKKRKEYPARCQRLLSARLARDCDTEIPSSHADRGMRKRVVSTNQELNRDLADLATSIGLNLVQCRQSVDNLTSKAKRLKVAEEHYVDNKVMEQKLRVQDATAPGLI